MAERRMIAKSVIDTDRFMDMSPTSQALYFHLNLNADDDGFITKPKAVMRMCGMTAGDIDELENAGYIIVFESGIVLIRHWKVNNYIKSDRYKPTVCREMEQVTIDEYSVYHLISECPEEEYGAEFRTGYESFPENETEEEGFPTNDEDYNSETENITPAIDVKRENPTNPRKNMPDHETRMNTMEPKWNQTGTTMDPQDRVRVRDRDRDSIHMSEPARKTEEDFSFGNVKGAKKEETKESEQINIKTGLTSSSACADTGTSYEPGYVVDLFNSICTSLPKVTKMTDSRKRLIRNSTRLLDCGLSEFFERVEDSDFLTGREGDWNGCSFDWIFKPANMVKIMEGNYDNREKAPQTQKAYGAAYDISEYESYSAYDDMPDYEPERASGSRQKDMEDIFAEFESHSVYDDMPDEITEYTTSSHQKDMEDIFAEYESHSVYDDMPDYEPEYIPSERDWDID